MIKKYILGLTLGIGMTAIAVTPAAATNSTIPDHKIGICHATGSSTNPYVFIVVDKHAADAHAKHQDGRDIIGAKSAADCPHKVAATPTPTPASGSGSVLSATTTSVAQPTTLPVTGGDLSALIGLPAMLVAGRAYLRSRR